MSEPQNPARGVIPVSLVVLFSMTMAGILVKQTKLDPIRPTEREAAIEVPQWEDPFLSTESALLSFSRPTQTRFTNTPNSSGSVA